MAYDILLGPDLDIPESCTHTTGIETIAQRVHIRLSVFRSEWMLDVRKGMPFVEWLTAKISRRRADEIAQFVRAEIESTPGVLRVTELTAVLVLRTLTISGTVIAEDGEQFAFVVNPLGDAADPHNATPFFLYQLNTVRGIAP